MTEIRKGTVNLSSNDICIRAGFQVVTEELIAGGPIEIEFFINSLGLCPLQLSVSGDRMRQRPGQFIFMAVFEGLSLNDPMVGFPDMGGPLSVVQVATANPWYQRLILNQFVGLEVCPGMLEPGALGQLFITCRRSFPLTGEEQVALLLAEDVRFVEVQLKLELPRNDARLASLVEELVDEVCHGPTEQRDRPLKVLLSLRTSTAIARWRTLVNHTDPLVVGQVRQSLWNIAH